MSDPSTAFQQAVLARLAADPEVQAIVADRVGDMLPATPVYPCISLGASEFGPFTDDGLSRTKEALQISGWTQDGTHGSAKVLGRAIAAALRAPLSLPDPFAMARPRLLLARVIRDPDGATMQAVLQIEAEIEVQSG